MDPFTAHLGRSQGRVERSEGSAVVVLGELEPSWTADLAPGDYVEVTQVADLTGVDVVRARGALRTPAEGRWRVSLLVAGAEAAALAGWPGRTRTVSDLAANVSGIAAPTEIAVRLTFMAP